MLEITNLTKYFTDTLVLDIPQLSLATGLALVVVGHNGAGKTTLLQLLTGMSLPSSGCVTINSYSLTREPLAAKASLAFVPATPLAFLHFTAREYWQLLAVLYPNDAILYQQRLDKYQTQLQLSSDDTLQPLSSLSLGTQKKVLFVGALALATPLLICDEPWTGLDPHTREQLVQAFSENKHAGQTQIFTTHDRELIAQADLILQLQDGHINYFGDHATFDIDSLKLHRGLADETR